MVLNKIFGKKKSTNDINSLKERFSQVSGNQNQSGTNEQPPSFTPPNQTVEVHDALGNPIVEEKPRVEQLQQNIPPSFNQNSFNQTAQPQQVAQPQFSVPNTQSNQPASAFGQQPLGVAIQSSPLPTSTIQPSQQQPVQTPPQMQSQSSPIEISSTTSEPKKESLPDLPSWAVESTGEEIANEISESTQSTAPNKATETLEQIEDKYYDAKLNSLIIDQVKELIEIDNNLNTKIEDISSEMKKEILEREQLAKKVDQHFDKVKELERNMEKFLGLYEMVTNQFNPFVDKGSTDMFLDAKDKKYENVVVQDPNSFAAMSSSAQPSSSIDNPIPTELQPQQVIQPIQQQPVAPPLTQSQPMQSQPVQQTNGQWAYCPIHHTIHPSMHFELKNGQKLSSIYDVLAVLEQMDEETFTHHVNLSQNDFSDWVYRVLGLTDLGQQLQIIKTRPEMIQSVRSYIQEKMKSANQ